MLIRLSQEFADKAEGAIAEEIIRKCVHCGFCTATCPTYQVVGDERDSPRGRIYIIKSLLEGNDVSQQSRLHLDRCLTCRACETVCPSGVEYGRLLDIGRKEIKQKLSARSLSQETIRKLLTYIVPYRRRFAFLFGVGKLVHPLLPKRFKAKIPRINHSIKPLSIRAKRKVILFQGCVQANITPATNIATENVLTRLGIECITVKNEGCCGALSQHLDFEQQAQKFMKNNIDAWIPYIEEGAEAIISTASGCGVSIKDYKHYLQFDDDYKKKAERISRLCKDIGEFLSQEDTKTLKLESRRKVVFQCPCTLQHGQRLTGQIEQLLIALGFELLPVNESHLCCGSAGSYSILQADISHQLRERKLKNLLQEEPEFIVTANIGCQLHLQEATDVTVKHWIELFEEEISR